jgi:hypothetical protein
MTVENRIDPRHEVVVRTVEHAVDFAALRRMHDLIGKVNGCRSLMDTLQAVVEGVVEAVGFDVAAISYVHVDGTFEVLAVAGSTTAGDELLGRRQPADAYEEEFALADEWGALRFVPHERLPDGRGRDGSLTSNRSTCRTPGTHRTPCSCRSTPRPMTWSECCP